MARSDPKERSSGGTQRFGATSKMGERTLRRLLIIGGKCCCPARLAKKAFEGERLAQMLARKPRMLVIVALANKMARIVWSMMTNKSSYRTSAGAA
ncbi:hypothetical protein DC439_24155 (plasmid) [Agrobacterium tumefaciens]|nr:hypothetical protein DC439_24155 [Agrobacterium tumefaciens]